MPSTPPITFGDTVRVLTTPDTEARGLAGLTGQVYGETTPSVMGVSVIGVLTRDYAINVHFDGKSETFWFASEMLEFVDHAAGSEIGLDGVPKKWTRNSSGEWVETRDRKPWWRFW